MSNWQLPHLYALLMSQSKAPWRWRLSDAEGERCWALVQDSESGDPLECGVYAVGPQLTLQARVLAMVTPALLHEVGRRALLQQECIERGQFLETVLQRLTQRAYQHKHSEDYADLRQAMRELVVIRRLLRASEPPLAQELEVWEQEALDPQPGSPASD